MTDQQIEVVLEKARVPTANLCAPPTHTYHMKREDARAIVAYLKSLSPAER
jgi:hypothetical protein